MTVFRVPVELACLTAHDLFDQRVEDTLDPARRRWLVEHLMGCDPCSDAFGQVVRAAVIDGRLPRLDVPELPRPLRTTVRESEDQAWGVSWRDVVAAVTDAAAAVRETIINGLMTPAFVPVGGSGKTVLFDASGEPVPDGEWGLAGEAPTIGHGRLRLSIWVRPWNPGSRLICSLTLSNGACVRFEKEPVEDPPGYWRADFHEEGFPPELSREIRLSDVKIIVAPLSEGHTANVVPHARENDLDRDPSTPGGELKGSSIVPHRIDEHLILNEQGEYNADPDIGQADFAALIDQNAWREPTPDYREIHAQGADERGSVGRPQKSAKPSSGIFAIVNTTSGERYVGATKDIRRLVRNYLRQLESGASSLRLLQEAWDEHGAGCFQVIVLEEVFDNRNEPGYDYHVRPDNLSLARQYYVNERSEYNHDKAIVSRKYHALVEDKAWRETT